MTVESGEDQAVDDSFIITPPRPATTPMEWGRPQEDTIAICSLNDKINGCVVSLPSSDDCSTSDDGEHSLIPLDPLDYRKDWSTELRTDLTMCISQNPGLFLIHEEKRIVIPVADDNSLCSHLSEDYKMDSEDNMTGLWDGEKHDIIIPDWVVES